MVQRELLPCWSVQFWNVLSCWCHFSPRAREDTPISLIRAGCEARSGWHLHRRLQSLWTFLTKHSVQVPQLDSYSDCQIAGWAPGQTCFSVSAACAVAIVTKLPFTLSCAGPGSCWRNCCSLWMGKWPMGYVMCHPCPEPILCFWD